MTTTLSTRRRLAAALALSALAAAPLLGSGASAQSPGARTLSFTELDKGATFKHVRNTKTKARRANLLGDLIVFANPVADASGQVIGKSHNVCVTTVGAREFPKSVITCNGSMVLRDGMMTWQGSLKAGASPVTGAVTGGTGAYANARGGFVSKDGQTTITLAGS